ncbi:MAG: ORF6N domain-containing protein [Candidatus Aureabacteria bacterium]|nr:ORF6N domain-containing protein [Candidatus Auribacterota bacterium]
MGKRDRKIDFTPARMYDVTTKALNQAVKRNEEKFPSDFMFQLTLQEVTGLKSRAVSNVESDIRSQIVTASAKRNIRYPPYAFTEHGAIMAATVLNSPLAVQMSVLVVRAFVKMRETLAATETMARRLAEIEKTLLSHDGALRDLYYKIRPLLLPPPEKPKRRIGFGLGERRARYKLRVRRSK